ncbi:hypothetical protein ACQ4PT_050635 [Festuca glaucescens]
MDGSGQDNDAAAGEQPHLPSGHVFLDAVMAALADDVFMDARDDADDLEDIIRFGGHNYWGIEAVPGSGEATPTWAVLPSEMDVSGGQSDEAEAGQEPHLHPADTPPVDLTWGNVLIDSIMQALNDRDDGDDHEDIFGDVPASGEATRTGAAASRDTDGSGQSNDADAGEQPHPIPAPSSYERGFIHGVVIVVPSHENLHLVTFRAERNGHGDMNGYGDDAYSGGGFGAVPASDKAILELERAAVGETRETVCGVCLESFEEDDKIRKMPCSHGFHERCIFKWLRVSRLCPHCRYAMPVGTSGYEDDVVGAAHYDEEEDDEEGNAYLMEM